MFTIENDHLKVTAKAKGAELDSIFHKQFDLEYMWNADPAYWAKKSPILFPIVGTLKNNTFIYNGQSYQLPRHGLAREKDFLLVDQQPDSMTFCLNSNEESLKVYPFPFQFCITYHLNEDRLTTTYIVKNTGTDTMYFSVGGHPAFKVPLTNQISYDDYMLVFNKEENAGRWPVSKEGLIENQSIPLLNNTNILPLKKNLFKTDAIVFKQLQSNTVTLRSNKTTHGLHFQYTGFPFLGLWAAPGADFLCIEPWCGIADNVDSNQQLKDKEGIIRLDAVNTFEVSWSVQLF